MVKSEKNIITRLFLQILYTRKSSMKKLIEWDRHVTESYQTRGYNTMWITGDHGEMKYHVTVIYEKRKVFKIFYQDFFLK